MSGFNSILVRLKATAARVSEFEIQSFQFHTGSIKRLSSDMLLW